MDNRVYNFQFQANVTVEWLELYYRCFRIDTSQVGISTRNLAILTTFFSWFSLVPPDNALDFRVMGKKCKLC